MKPVSESLLSSFSQALAENDLAAALTVLAADMRSVDHDWAAYEEVVPAVLSALSSSGFTVVEDGGGLELIVEDQSGARYRFGSVNPARIAGLVWVVSPLNDSAAIALSGVLD